MRTVGKWARVIVLAVMLAAGIAAPAAATTGTGPVVEHGVIFHRDSTGVLVSSPTFWNVAPGSVGTCYQLTGAGLGHAAQIFCNGGGLFVIEALSANEWKIKENSDHTRCLQRVAIFINIETCAQNTNSQVFDPVQAPGGGFQFRSVGTSFYIGVNNDLGNGHQVYAATVSGGHDITWVPVFPN